MKCDTLIIDGRHALWRTSDAFKDLGVELEGEHIGTGGMYGFLCLAQRIHQRYGGKVIVAWEGDRKKNFRRKLYPEYKDKGEATEEQLEIIFDMAKQERRLMAMLRAMGVEQYCGDGCEADDVIGRLAKEESERKRFVLIYSGDSDLRQLVTPLVSTVSPGRRGPDKVYTEADVEDKHGVPPKYIADLKALSGDSSDNIPGVKGVGEVTAAKLIQAFGGVKKVLKAAVDEDSDWPVAERFRKMLITSRNDILLFKKLTKIKTDASMIPIKPRRNKKMLIKHFRAYRFSSLLVSTEMYGLMRMAGND